MADGGETTRSGHCEQGHRLAAEDQFCDHCGAPRARTTCPNGHTIDRPNADFCPTCGEPLDSAFGPDQAPAAPTSAIPDGSSRPDPVPSRRASRRRIVAVGVGTIAALATIAALFLLGGDQDDVSDGPTITGAELQQSLLDQARPAPGSPAIAESIRCSANSVYEDGDTALCTFDLRDGTMEVIEAELHWTGDGWNVEAVLADQDG